jgi:hypothetical protein
VFGELNRLPPAASEPSTEWIDPPLPFPPDTREGRLCGQVYAHARGALDGDPEGWAAAAARLAAEYREEERMYGAVRLPDPSTLEPVQELLARVKAGLTQAERRAFLGPGREGG